MKKALAVVLCLCMVIAILAGCSKSETPSSSGSSTPSSSTPSSSGSAPASSDEPAPSGGDDLSPAEKAIAERKESGNYPKIVFSFFNWSGPPAGTERISELLRAYCREKIGVDVQLLIMDAATYRQQIPLMFADGEQFDIFAGNAIGLQNCIYSGYAYDLNRDQLFETYGSDIPKELPEWMIECCRTEESIFYLPNVRAYAFTVATCGIFAEYLDGIGYDYESKWEDSQTKEFIRLEKWEDFDPIFAQLHEKYPDRPVIASSPSLDRGYGFDKLGGDWYGVLLDPVSSLKVEDIWSSRQWMDICQRNHRYCQLGYVQVSMTERRAGFGTPQMVVFPHGLASNGRPGLRSQLADGYGADVIPFGIGPDRILSDANDPFYCISSKTADPVAAMQTLNLLYTDEYIANLLCWGEEGVEYQVLDNGTIDYMPGISKQNCEYVTDVQWEMPNELLSHPWHTDTPDLWDRMRVFNENAGRSLAFGFTWDNREYATQFTALQNIYDEYYNPLVLGFYDPNEKIPEMNERLEAEGLNEYIEAKRSALWKWAVPNS